MNITLNFYFLLFFHFFFAGTKLAARAYTNSTTGTFVVAIVSAVGDVFGANVGDSAGARGQGAAGAVDARQRQLVFNKVPLHSDFTQEYILGH